MNTALLTLATDPGALALVLATCLLVIAAALRSLRRGAAEDQRVTQHVWAMRESAFTWDVPTQFSGLAERTDTATLPRIDLTAGAPL
jgi:hypothetical protein